jgi:hypothetical protein
MVVGSVREQPSAGLAKAIFVNFIDVGMQPGYQNGPAKPEMYIIWEIEEMDSTGKRFTVQQKYTNNLGERAKLALHIESYRGKKLAVDERKAYDMDPMLYKPCQISLVESNGWMNVDAVLPAAKDAYWSPETPHGYIPANIQKKIENQLVKAEPKKEQFKDDIF